MMNNLVVAVVPTYNSSVLVLEQVNKLQALGLRKVIICDDNSTDGTVEKLKEKFGDSIKILAGSKNLGPAGNRNRCLPELKNDEYVLFVDADCKITFRNSIPELIKREFVQPDVGVIGFNVIDKEGRPMSWNYGDLMHPVHEAADKKLQEMLEAEQISNQQFITYAPRRAASLRMLPEGETKEVGFVAEGCMAVRSSVLKEVKGFAEQIRYHETHDFCARVKALGYRVVFNSTTLVRHLEYDTRMTRRDEDIQEGRFYYYQKHWGMNKKVFDKLFE